VQRLGGGGLAAGAGGLAGTWQQVRAGVLRAPRTATVDVPHGDAGCVGVSRCAWARGQGEQAGHLSCALSSLEGVCANACSAWWLTSA
jgi:hypothetical protein